MMDFASRKLVRRARIRRNHERQVRVAAVKSRKRALLQSSDALQEHALLGREEKLDSTSSEDEFSKSNYSTQSTTVPSLPSLSGCQSLTVAATSKRSGNAKGVLSENLLAPAATDRTPHTGLQAVNGSDQPSIGVLQGKPRRGNRIRGTRRNGAKFDDTLSDSNVYKEPTGISRARRGDVHSDSCYQGIAGHLSDSAASGQKQQQQREQEDGGLPRVRKHGRVRPQGADAKRKRARQLERLKPYNSKIETVLEEELPGHSQANGDKNVHAAGVNLKYDAPVVVNEGREPKEVKPKKTSPPVSLTEKVAPKQPKPVIADLLPSNPPSPTLSRMVRKKTEALDISETTLQQIKEMSSHLRIVNWLWDSKQLPLQAGRRAKSLRAASPGAATNVTTTSDNLVVVRGGGNVNWFDLPRKNYHEPYGRQEQLSPLSVNSEFKSDYEDELMSLV